MFQPDYTDCPNCGSADHDDYDCPCGCHGDEAPSRARQARLKRVRSAENGTATPIAGGGVIPTRTLQP